MRALVTHLRSAQSGLLGQLVRFGLVGASVMVFYLVTTTVLSQVIGLPFEVALAIGSSLALAMHFTLQRLFVWLHEERFALPIGHQLGRYLLMAGTQYVCTAISTAVLPKALGLPTEAIYLMTACVVTPSGFLLMRFLIFHGETSTSAPAPANAPARVVAPQQQSSTT
jgi:putative flippase GtrA